MAELLNVLIQLAEKLFPLRRVMSWEVGVAFIFGRYWRTLPPFIYPVIPYLIEIHNVPTVPSIHPTGIQTVSMRDQRTLVFSATITLQVEDAARAWCTVERYAETAVELVSGLLAERLADAKIERFDPARGKLDNLREELREEADKATSAYGVRVLRVRFPTFVIGPRTYRLLGDSPAAHVVK